GTGITITTTGYTISGAQSGNYTLTQPTLSADIAAVTLTVTGLTGDNKVYDGAITATVSGTAALSGVIGGDVVTLGGTSVYTFGSANIGTGITITTTGYTLSGAQSGNYTLTQPTLSADITAKELTVIGLTGDNKIYDGTTVATVSGTAALSGVVGGDVVTLDGTPTFIFASSNIGTGITITTTGVTLSGAGSGNYTLTQPTLSADITAASLTVTALIGDDKIYDGTTSASASEIPILSGIIGGDVVTLGGTAVYTFASANIGTGITITTTGYTISGAQSGNYMLTQPTLSADITAKELTVTGLTGDNKVYDGTTTATASGTAALSGIIGGDVVTLGGTAVYTFVNANIGTGITITTTGYTLSGAQSGNYTLTQPTLSADITAATLTVTGLTGDNKIYDGTTTATASGTAALSGIIGGDVVTLGGTAVYTFGSANIGTGITITTTGYTLSGAQSGNYTLTQPTLSADITAKELTITGLTGNNKVYDGTTTGSASGTAALSGIIGGDVVTLGGTAVYTFASANIGTGITITTTGYTISGAQSGNYTLTQPTLSAAITTKELTVTGLTGDNKVYDGTTTATASGTAVLSGIIGGDVVTLGGTAVYTFTSSNIGTGIAITTTGYTISGVGSGNYTLTQPSLAANITAANLTVTGLTGDNKAYDGTTVATASGTATLSGIIGGDVVTLGGTPVYVFASPNVGTAITITTTGFTISGVDFGNYALTQPTLSADILSPSVAFTSTSSSGLESVASANITVDLSGPSNLTATVDYLISGTATGSGTDYTLANGTLTFIPGDVSETITIASIVDDAILEANETVIIILSNPINATFGVNRMHTYTITNNDAAAVTIADVSGNENDGVITVTATLDNPVQGGFTVEVSTTDGTATIVDSDYTAVVGQTLTFAGTVGETQTFTITPTGDTTLEADETLTVTQSNLSATTLGVVIIDGATVTINNDDSAEVTIADISGNENDGVITVTATLDNAVQGGFTVDVSTTDGTATVGDGDYGAVVSQTLIFTGNAGETQTFTITPTGDTTLEADETLTVSQSNLSGTTLGVVITDGATVTISNDDSAEVTIADISGNENDGAIIVTATLDNAVQGGFTVDVSTADGTATTADIDYSAVISQLLTFAGNAGETQTFTVTPTDDTKLETNETLTVSQSNLSATTLGVVITDGAIVTIDNDDSTSITIDDITGNEADGTINIVATLGNAVQDGFALHATTIDGTAVAASDFTALSDQLAATFTGAAGEVQNIILTLTDDTVGESIEQLTMMLSSISGTTVGSSIDITDTATVTITDDDAPVVTMVSVPTDGNYGIGDNLDFTVTFTNPASSTGSPFIPITIGTTTVQAVLNGTVSNALTANFRYTVVEGNLDTDGIAVGTDINLNGGTILGSSNIPAILTLNNVSSTANVNVDGIKPTVVITTNAADPTNIPFTATFTFSEDVTGFDMADITVGNGSAGAVSMVSASVYTSIITPTTDGTVTVDVAADVAQDAVNNNNVAAVQYSVLYDATNPTI
ncbi:MAG: hypothetical protein JKY02_03415, partial [Flavobacteriaceae bacterium]|nr:hypothetical protein [Flavobacteriaceae bacterium]